MTPPKLVTIRARDAHVAIALLNRYVRPSILTADEKVALRRLKLTSEWEHRGSHDHGDVQHDSTDPKGAPR